MSKTKQTISQRIRNAALTGSGLHLKAEEAKALYLATITVKEAAASADEAALAAEAPTNA